MQSLFRHKIAIHHVVFWVWGIRHPTWHGIHLFTIFFLVCCEQYWPFPIHNNKCVSVSLTRRPAGVDSRNGDKPNNLFFFYLLNTGCLFRSPSGFACTVWNWCFPFPPLSVSVQCGISITPLKMFYGIFSFVGWKIYINFFSFVFKVSKIVRFVNCHGLKLKSARFIKRTEILFSSLVPFVRGL